MSTDEVSALAEAFPDPVSAKRVLINAGLPAGRIPTWNTPDAESFWSMVSVLIRNGVLLDGREAVLVAALDMYPANRVFAAGAGETKSACTRPLTRSTGSPDLPNKNVPLVLGRIPQCPPCFQYRTDVYSQLSADENCGTVQVLTGMRGIGKTQIAAAYARSRIDDQWSTIVWINASTNDDIVAAFAELAAALYLRVKDDNVISAADRARLWLHTAERCLIVFDNALDSDVVRPWLPVSGKSQILITTTQRDFDDLGLLVEVDIFTDREALAFLRERTGLDDDLGARGIASEVGHLPLALAHSAAVIRRQRLQYDVFLQRLRTIPVAHYLSRRSGDPYPHSAAAAILLSIESCVHDHPPTNSLIDLLSLLSPGVNGQFVVALAQIP
ncbi:effector-associated domain EAD1-containing protein [Parafrankia sp. FMc2]|uniref:effector-associated domain EAD1-containing protein n=1 Tax=Parafrankia sp. FMc2 TaxID=3233196 RepID=UPI0034D5020F